MKKQIYSKYMQRKLFSGAVLPVTPRTTLGLDSLLDKQQANLLATNKINTTPLATNLTPTGGGLNNLGGIGGLTSTAASLGTNITSTLSNENLNKQEKIDALGESVTETGATLAGTAIGGPVGGLIGQFGGKALNALTKAGTSLGGGKTSTLGQIAGSALNPFATATSTVAALATGDLAALSPFERARRAEAAQNEAQIKEQTNAINQTNKQMLSTYDANRIASKGMKLRLKTAHKLQGGAAVQLQFKKGGKVKKTPLLKETIVAPSGKIGTLSSLLRGKRVKGTTVVI